MNDETPKKPRWTTRLRHWIASHRTTSLIIAGVGLILIASGIAVAILSQPPVEPVSHTAPKPKPKPPVVYYSPLTGNVVKTEAITKQATTAIMIENSPDARPQSGMSHAGVVYEAIAEGGITRFLTIYQEDKPPLVGPVRSVRMYYVDWLTPYNASVSHVGGSYQSLKVVRNGNYRDIDQFFNGASYWRAADRYAPHNVYTDFKKLDALNKSKGYTTSKFTGFSRVDEKPSSKPTASTVTINISGADYNTRYTYDKKHNTYKRFLGGVPHTDREAGQLAPKVVIAMRVNESTVFEDGYREQITTSGSGKATIFQNGIAKDVTWHKKNRAAQLSFTDKNGADVPLIRGQTWIAAVPNSGGSVSWK